MWRSGRTLASVFVAALSGWSCGSTAPDSAPKVASIVVSPANSTLALDAQLPLQAQVHDGSGALVSDADVVWTVEDPTIVSVSTAGVVTALGIGTSQVAANALGKSGLATITVTPPPVAPTPTSPPAQAAGAVATVRVTAPSKKVKPGSTMQLTATALDEKTRVYIEKLESMVDEERLPSGDELIGEIERFLRERGNDIGEGQIH